MFPAAVVLQASQALSAKDFKARCAELSKARDWKGLEQAAHAQAAADPKDAEAFSALGYALLAQNRADEGRAACEAAIKLDRHQIAPYIYLGLSYAQAGDKKSVLSVGQRLSAAAPFGPGVYYKVPILFEAAVGDPGLQVEPEAKPLHSALSQPPYPPDARSENIQGDVVLDLTIGPDGTPTSIQVLAGPRALVSAAISTVKQFRYQPRMKDGKAVAFHAPGFVQFKVSN